MLLKSFPLLILGLLAQSLSAYQPALSASALQAPMDGWLLVGQSNAVGTSTGDSVVYTSVNNDTLIPIWKRAGDDPISLPSGVETLDTTDSAARGCEYGFLRTMYSRGQYRVLMLKHATNGKALYNFWRPGNTGYTELVESVAQFELDIAPQTVRWRGIIWVQGQADANVDALVAGGYQNNLGKFVAQLRLDLATPDLIFISPEHPPAWSVKPYADVVKAAVTAYAAADARAVSYGVEDTTTRDAGTHYQSTDGSFELIGIRAANAYLDNF